MYEWLIFQCPMPMSKYSLVIANVRVQLLMLIVSFWLEKHNGARLVVFAGKVKIDQNRSQPKKYSLRTPCCQCFRCWLHCSITSTI